jgi:hypothetical protein
MLVLLIACVLMTPYLGPKSGVNPTSDTIEQGVFIGLVIMTVGLLLAMIGLFFEEGDGLTSLWIAIAGVVIHVLGLGFYVFYVFPV